MTAPPGTIIADLGDGLLLRSATTADTDAVATFNARVHGAPDRPDEGIGQWVRELMSGGHPTCSAGDFTLVEDTRSGAIVSSLNLISQRWSYGGVELGVGRPEVVGTHPEYRRRGLVRRQMDVVHRWSAERGELMQAITGIPWYYRQFGYEMTLQRYAPRQGYRHTVPALTPGREEPYRLRPAVEDDLPFIATLAAAGRERSLLSCVRDAALWRYELRGRSDPSMTRPELHVIEPAAGAHSVAPVGFLAHSWINGPFVRVAAFELAPGASWLDVTPSVLRHLLAAAEAWERAMPDRRLTALSFALGANHPAYAAAPSSFPYAPRPSAHYLRVPDLPRFLRHVAPVLEGRLARSPAAGYTGELRLSFYRDGVRLTFDAGRLKAAEPWRQPERHEAGAAFPELTFLQLVFGHRSLAELQHAFADCLVRDEPRVLLEALFPPTPSEVWLLD